VLTIHTLITVRPSTKTAQLYTADYTNPEI